MSFTGAVAGEFALTRNSDGAAVDFNATATINNGVTVVVLDGFSGTATEFGSLADGRYTLTVLSGQITAGGQQLDGNSDGAAGDNYAFGDPQGLFRFFGDFNGDRRVNGPDLLFYFLPSYFKHTGDPGFLAGFDFNGDGRVDISDFGQFSVRFFTALP